MMRPAQQYRCLKSFEWNGNAYVAGLSYTDTGNAAHEAFGRMAEDAVKDGGFERIEGKPKASIGGRAAVIQESKS